MIYGSATTWLHQAPLIGQHDNLYPVPDPEFHEYPPDVSLDGQPNPLLVRVGASPP